MHQRPGSSIKSVLRSCPVKVDNRSSLFRAGRLDDGGRLDDDGAIVRRLDRGELVISFVERSGN